MISDRQIGRTDVKEYAVAEPDRQEKQLALAVELCYNAVWNELLLRCSI